jgi:hypothetical protein
LLSNVSAASDGTVWGVDKNGDVYRYVRHSDGSYGWELLKSQPKTKISVVAVGSETNIWVLDKDDNIFRYVSEVWQPVPLPAGSLAYRRSA